MWRLHFQPQKLLFYAIVLMILSLSTPNYLLNKILLRIMHQTSGTNGDNEIRAKSKPPSSNVDKQPYFISSNAENTRMYFFDIDIDRLEGCVPLLSTIWNEKMQNVHITFILQHFYRLFSNSIPFLYCLLSLKKYLVKCYLIMPILWATNFFLNVGFCYTNNNQR